MLITYLAVVTGRSVFVFFSALNGPFEKKTLPAVCNVLIGEKLGRVNRPPERWFSSTTKTGCKF